MHTVLVHLRPVFFAALLLGQAVLPLIHLEFSHPDRATTHPGTTLTTCHDHNDSHESACVACHLLRTTRPQAIHDARQAPAVAPDCDTLTLPPTPDAAPRRTNPESPRAPPAA